MGKGIDLSKIGVNFELNEGQKESINAVSNWLSSGTNTPFALMGSAGTGKTTVTKIIIAGLKANGIKYAIAAPTHQAKAVISKLSGSKAKTIHSLLGKGLGDTEVGKELKFSAGFGKDIKYDSVIIIDEMSMIPDSIVDEIMSAAANKSAKVLFVGDWAQLFPVNNYDNTGRPKMSKSLESENSSELTQIMRISGGNPIASTFEAMRLFQPEGAISVGGVLFENKSGKWKAMVSRRDNFNNIGGIKFVSEHQRMDVINIAIDKYFKSEDYDKNVRFAKFIAYRNSVVDSLNELVRDRLGKTGIVEVGERLSGQIKISSFDSVYSSSAIENDDEYIVTNVGEERVITSSAVPGVSIPVITIDIETENGDSNGGRFNLLSDMSDEKIAEIQKAIIKRKSEIYELKSELDYRSMSRCNLIFIDL